MSPIRVHRQTNRWRHTTTERSTNLITSSNSLRSIGGDEKEVYSKNVKRTARQKSRKLAICNGRQINGKIRETFLRHFSLHKERWNDCGSKPGRICCKVDWLIMLLPCWSRLQWSVIQSLDVSSWCNDSTRLTPAPTTNVTWQKVESFLVCIHHVAAQKWRFGFLI